MKITSSKVITRSLVGVSLLASFFVASTVFATNNHNNGNNNPGNNITICHATSSHNNPYVVNTPNANGIVDGHTGHFGGVYPINNWGDIIPPFTYNENGQTLQYPGKNWTSQGQAIWNNGCNIPQATSTPTPTPSVTPSPSPVVSPSPTPCVNCGGTTVTPTPTPTPVVTPTPSPVASSTPAPTATPAASNNPSGSTTTPAAPQGQPGQILGAKTLAPTGNTDSLMTLMTTLGIVLMALSAKRYAQETR